VQCALNQIDEWLAMNEFCVLSSTCRVEYPPAAQLGLQ